MTKLVSILVLLLPLAHGWIEQRRPFSPPRQMPLTRLRSSIEEENPCWQDISDDDCAMDRAYAASFVAAEWLKKMPCGLGIADCDMPVDLTAPGNRHEEGADEVDVMSFLNLKRAGGVNTKSVEKGKAAP